MTHEMKTRVVCKDFIRHYCKGQVVDSIQASLQLEDVWGLKVDWHEMTNALEALTQSDEAERSGEGPDRHAYYLIR